MGVFGDMAKNADKEIEKMKKKEELKKQLEKAKEQGAHDKEKEQDMKSM